MVVRVKAPQKINTTTKSSFGCGAMSDGICVTNHEEAYATLTETHAVPIERASSVIATASCLTDTSLCKEKLNLSKPPIERSPSKPSARMPSRQNASAIIRPSRVAMTLALVLARIPSVTMINSMLHCGVATVCQTEDPNRANVELDVAGVNGTACSVFCLCAFNLGLV